MADNNKKKYASLSTLQTFLGNLKNIFASKTDLSTEISKKADISHSHDDLYYTETEIDVKLANKSDTTHSHDEKYDIKGAASEALESAKLYTNEVKDDLLNGAGAAYDSLKELGDLIDENVDAIDALEIIATNKADKTHTHTVANITDVTVTATELNYMDGVTSNVQAQLDNKASVIIREW